MTDEFKGKTHDELILLLRETKKELLNLRFRKAAGDLQDSSAFRKLRFKAARISTQLTQLRKAEAA